MKLIILSFSCFFLLSTLDITQAYSQGLNMSPNSKTSGNRLSYLIESRKSQYDFKAVGIFSLSENMTLHSEAKNFTNRSTILNMSKINISNIMKNRYEDLLIDIPLSNSEHFEVEVTLYDIFSENFRCSSNDGEYMTNELVRGLHYRGIVKGDSNSLVAISIFKDNIMGIISNIEGNYNLGTIMNNNSQFTEDCIFYLDKNKILPEMFSCIDNQIESLSSQEEVRENLERFNPNEISAGRYINIEYETDYSIYQYFGFNVQNVLSFVSGMFNVVSTIYFRDNINVVFNYLTYWYSLDPYASYNDLYQLFLSYTNLKRDYIQGNVAQFLTFRLPPAGWGHIDVLCKNFTFVNGSPFGRVSVASIQPYFAGFPNFSVSVQLSTHEMGHNFGSRHTHWCGWPGGPIDRCYVNNENLLPPPNCSGAADGCLPCGSLCIPISNGTIMSYCISGNCPGAYTNIYYGFGEYPKNLILSKINSAPCLPVGLAPLGNLVPEQFSLQNYPNPFNPNTMLQFEIPISSQVKLRVFDNNGRLIRTLINERLVPGVYQIPFNGNNLSSGIYIYNLESEDLQISKKMVLVK